MVLESPYARAICDARPAIVGHTLVCSTNHVASAFDLADQSYAHLRVMQEEISRRTYEAFNEVGVYEHGRSMLCRFHVVNPGHIHAHLHVLPVSFDLIGRSGYEHKWDGPPGNSITAEDRYLYQEIGKVPNETWAVGKLPVRRHFVRAELEEVLRQGQRPWIPLTATPDDHDDAVEETASLISQHDVSERPQNVIALLGSDLAGKNRIANALGRSTNCMIFDVDLIFRLWALLAHESEKAPNWLSTAITESFVNGRTVFLKHTGLPSSGGLRFEGRTLQSELFDQNLTPYLFDIRSNTDIRDQVDLIASILIRREPSVLIASEVSKHTSEVNPLKVYLLSGDLNSNAEEGRQVIELAASKNLQTIAPQWTDIRLYANKHKPEELADLIGEAWRLRFGCDFHRDPNE